MGRTRNYNPAHKAQVFDTLRREILAARLKVTLDEQLHRDTSTTVKRLAQMKLPPITRAASPVDRLMDRDPASARQASTGSFVRSGGSSAAGPDYTTADDPIRWENVAHPFDQTNGLLDDETYHQDIDQDSRMARDAVQDVAQTAKHVAQDVAQTAAAEARWRDAQR
jgi:hypothetical protein